MTRLHDAFDALADRGEPLGADAVLANAREAFDNGTLADLQAAPTGNRVRVRIVAVAALCVAVVAAVALISLNGTAPTPSNSRPVPFKCHGSVAGTRSAAVVIEVERDARAQVSVGAYTFRFAIRVRSHGQLFLYGRIIGPGLMGPPGFSSASGPLSPTDRRGGMTARSNIAGGPMILTCTR